MDHCTKMRDRCEKCQSPQIANGGCDNNGDVDDDGWDINLWQDSKW